MSTRKIAPAVDMVRGELPGRKDAVALGSTTGTLTAHATPPAPSQPNVPVSAQGGAAAVVLPCGL